MWSRNKANLYIRDAFNDFHYDPKALPSPIAQRKIYRNKLILTHLVGFGGGVEVEVGEQPPCYSFDGLGDYLSIPDHADWDFSTGNWTLECFANIKANDERASLITVDGYATGIQWNYNGVSARLNTYIVGTEYTFAFTPTNNTWHHFALVRNGNDLLCFADGVQKGSTEDITGLDLTGLSNGVRIGSIFYPTDLWDMDGRVDEVRISNTARYTSGFTPTNSPFSSDANTKVLIHCSEAKSGTTGSGATFTDSGNTGHTITENGNAIQDDVFGKFT